MNPLAEFGLPVARTAILSFGSQKVLGVERSDRQLHPSGSWVMCLPQEDFCQALGVPPHLKYESDGGPGLADFAAVLRGSERAGGSDDLIDQPGSVLAAGSWQRSVVTPRISASSC